MQTILMFFTFILLRGKYSQTLFGSAFLYIIHKHSHTIPLFISGRMFARHICLQYLSVDQRLQRGNLFREYRKSTHVLFLLATLYRQSTLPSFIAACATGPDALSLYPYFNLQNQQEPHAASALSPQPPLKQSESDYLQRDVYGQHYSRVKKQIDILCIHHAQHVVPINRHA